MRRSLALAVLTLVIAAGCSTLHPDVTLALANQAARAVVDAEDYAKIDCQGCDSCVQMQSATSKLAAAGASYDASKASEKEHLAYLDAVDRATSSIPECSCSQDAESCPIVRNGLTTARENLDIRQSINRPPLYKTMFGGLFSSD
mgnify:CR=1 FL=1